MCQNMLQRSLSSHLVRIKCAVVSCAYKGFFNQTLYKVEKICYLVHMFFILLVILKHFYIFIIVIVDIVIII